MLVLGEDPQKYGLGQSLLERLHTLYSTQTHTNAEHHCATLLHNYRCHRSLLALPSYLFYHSALIANRNASKQALLHPDTTYSLHFICSSLDDTIVEVKDSTNREEAVLLLEAAAKYVKEWPPEWGDRELKTVCVMATTANQVWYLTMFYNFMIIIFFANAAKSYPQDYEEHKPPAEFRQVSYWPCTRTQLC